MRTFKVSWCVLGALGLLHCGGEATHGGGALEQPGESETRDEQGSEQAPSDRLTGSDGGSAGRDSAPKETQTGNTGDGAATEEPGSGWGGPGATGAGGAPAGNDGEGDSDNGSDGGGDSGSTGSADVGPDPIPVCDTELGNRVVRLVPEEYGSIQAAIDVADYGDTVRVAPGTYDENLRLRSGVLLLGAGAGETILDGGGRGQNLIDASFTRDSVVRGFTLRNVGQGEGCADPDDPLRCSGDWYAAAVFIDGNMDDGCPTSIEIAENSIEDNEIGVMLYFQPGGRAHIHDNRFIDNRIGLVANHHGDGEGEATHNLFVGSEQALMLQASYLDVTHSLVAGVGTVLTQENVQRGDLACNLLYDYADLGNRMVLGQDSNMELTENPFLEGEFTLSPGAPTPGCSNDAGEPIVPGPRPGLFVEP